MTPAIFAESIRAVASWVGSVDAVVAHSMGAIVTAFAMQQGLSPRRVAFVAPAPSPDAGIQMLAQTLDLSPTVVGRLQDRVSNRLGRTWSDLIDGSIMRGHHVPLLVHHDRDDTEVPVTAATLIADQWKPSEVVITEGLGHRRILWHPDVVHRVSAFLAPVATVSSFEGDPWGAFLRTDLSDLSAPA